MLFRIRRKPRNKIFQVLEETQGKFIFFSLLVLLLFITPAFALYTGSKDNPTITPRITKANPNPNEWQTASQPSFSVSLTVEAAGVPISVEMPGKDDSEQVVRVIANVGSTSDQKQYEYNLSDQSVTVKGSFGEVTYTTSGNPEMNYTTLQKMLGLIRAAFVEIGLKFDPENQQLEIEDKYVNNIDSSIDVTVTSSESNVYISLTKGFDVASLTYNKTTKMFQYPSELEFGSGYEWNLYAGLPMAVIDDPYSGVSVASVDWSGLTKSQFARTMPFTWQFMLTVATLDQQRRTLATTARFTVEAQARLAEPEITDITWVDRDSGLIEIAGKGGDYSNPPDIYITSNDTTQKLNDTLSWLGDDWTVTNTNLPLSEGENKVNVIVRGSGSREVETGDVTVYLGKAGEPDLILLSPRDRQVLSATSFPFDESDLKIEGRATYGNTIKIQGQQITADYNDSFSGTINIKDLYEESNTITFEVQGSKNISLEKKIIGAYLFNSSAKSKKYVLRLGDFVFNGKGTSYEGFDVFPYEPNHTGIYIGNGNVAEAVYPGGFSLPKVVIRNLEYHWDNAGFYCATQVPKLVSQKAREMVVDLIKKQENELYDFPIEIRWNGGILFYLDGAYTPKNGKFYCSELAYWVWEDVASKEGFDFGIDIKNTLYPEEEGKDPDHSSILPAFLCRESMEVKQSDK